MNSLQRLQVAQSETREAINKMLAIPIKDRTEDHKGELETLTTKMQDSEVELRAALVAEETEEVVEVETEETPETRERLELRSKSRIGRYLAAAMNQRPVDGAEHEFSASLGLPIGQIPISLLSKGEPERREKQSEARAITPGVDAGRTPASVAGFVFSESVSSGLGVSFEDVPAGVRSYPVIETAPPSGSLAKGATALATASSITLATRSPHRIAGSFTVRLEDLSSYEELEDSLRESLLGSMTNSLDEAIINDNGSSGKLTGLFKVATDVSRESTEITFATGVQLFADLVDGQYASDFSDLSAIVGPGTFSKLSGLFGPLAAAPHDSLWGYIKTRLRYVVVSNRIPAVVSKGQKALVVRNRTMSPIRVAVWSGVSILVDAFSGSSEGTRKLVATMLVSSPHVPFTTDQVVELHPRVEA